MEHHMSTSQSFPEMEVCQLSLLYEKTNTEREKKHHGFANLQVFGATDMGSIGIHSSA